MGRCHYRAVLLPLIPARTSGRDGNDYGGVADAWADAGAEGAADNGAEEGASTLPVLVVRKTGERGDAALPAGGSWPTITPAGAVSLGDSFTPPRTKPAPSKTLSASG